MNRPKNIGQKNKCILSVMNIPIMNIVKMDKTTDNITNNTIMAKINCIISVYNGGNLILESHVHR